MTEVKKQYVLYEYLLYFWRKKWFFLIVPIITTVLIASAIYILKADKKFTGQMIVFTGSTTLKELTHPNNILSILQDSQEQDSQDLTADLDIFVSEKSQVKFTIKGDSEEEIKRTFGLIKDEYYKLLKSDYENRKKLSNDAIAMLEAKIVTLNDVLEIYRKLAADLQSDHHEDISFLILESESDLTDAELRVNKITADLGFLEEPNVLFQTVHPTKTYLKESIAIGLILGVLLTVALLMLLKYLFDARRNDQL